MIVAPMLNTSPLFALLISYRFVRKRELFSPRVVGTTLIVLGIITLVLVK